MEYFFVGFFGAMGFPLVLAFVSLLKDAFRSSLDLPND